MLSNFNKKIKKLVSFWKMLQYWKNKTFSYKTIISVVKILGPGLKGCICLQRMTHCWKEYFPNLLESLFTINCAKLLEQKIGATIRFPEGLENTPFLSEPKDQQFFLAFFPTFMW